MRKWLTYDRVPVEDIKQALLTHVESDTIIKIGTDAQRVGRRTDFCTVLILYKPGKGARVYYSREPIIRQLTLWEKLSKETWSSLEVAMMVDDLLHLKDRIEVHVDANPDHKFESSDHVKALTGMVMGQGFRCVLKPEAAAASHCADHVVKNKHLPSPERKQIFRRRRR